MKVLTYIFTFAYLLTFSPVLAEKSNESRIAAVVNDKSILKSSLEQRVNLVIATSKMQMTPQIKKDLRERLLQQMIDEELQRQLAEKFEIKIDEADIKATWRTMERRFGMSEGELNDFLKQHSIPNRVVQDQILANLGWQHYIHGRYGSLVQVTKEDVANELNLLQLEKQKDQALLSEIVVKSESPEQAEEAKQKANQLVAKLRAGTPFPLIAQQFSHSASAAGGGDIGWVNVDQLDGSLKAKVKNMKLGDISDPVNVKGDYHIVGLRDRHGVGSLGNPVEYVSFQKIEFLFPMFGGDAGKEQTYINANQIRDQGRSCSMMHKITHDRPRIKNESIQRYRVDRLHPELQKLLKDLKPGERSQLMNTGQGFIMFMLCKRDIVKPSEPSEDEIRHTLMEKRLSLIADRELRNLRRAAFVEIRS